MAKSLFSLSKFDSPYEDFIDLLQNQQRNLSAENPYGAIGIGLSNALQGFLMGRDRKQKRDASEAVAAAFLGGGNGGLLSDQVAGIAGGGGLPSSMGIRKSLSALKGNPYAQEMLLDLNLDYAKGADETLNRMRELGFEGEVNKDVYRDRRLADAGYIGQEYGLKSQLSNQEYRQRVDEAERQSGLDLTKIRTQHTLDNERALNEIEARLGADLTRSEANVWEHGAKSNIDVDKFRQQEGIETQQLGIRGEAELDRRRREFGYQTDEALREKRGSVDEDIRKKQGEIAAETASAATVFFTSKSVEGDIARNIVTIGPRILAGEEVTPQERAAYNFSIQKATEPKTIESNGQIVTIPGMTPDQIFQGIGMAAMQGQAAPQATEALGPSSVAPYSRDALLSALIRQESGGNPRARSPVGARGLMQLMPATAMEVAREMGMRNFKIDWLDNPEINQKLGTFYLDKQLRANNGNVPMSLAAYNAGPHRVRQWREKYGDPLKGEISVREWVEKIPFRETKGYVKNIMAMMERQGSPAAEPDAILPSRQPLPPPVQPPPVPQGGAGLPPGAEVYSIPPSPLDQLRLEKEKAEVQKQRLGIESDAKAAEAQTRKKAALLEASLKRVNAATRILDDESNWASGPVAKLGRYIQGTPASDLSYEINALKNQFTGANLDMLKGTISDADVAMLGGLAGTLEVGMPRDQAKRTIADMKAILTASQGGDVEDEDLSGMTDDEIRKALGL